MIVRDLLGLTTRGRGLVIHWIPEMGKRMELLREIHHPLEFGHWRRRYSEGARAGGQQ